MCLVKFNHISKRYHTSGNFFTALDDIHLEIQQGEMLAIQGVSGSGKSTLMHIMGLLDRPSEGEYIFSGKNIATISDKELASIRNQKIGFIFQAFFLLPRHTVLQNVVMPLFYRRTQKNEAEKIALTMLDKVGIAHLYQRKPHELSGGQQQRVAIARALVGYPEIILADEPTGALDSKTGKEVMELLCALNKNENKTVVIITHDTQVSAYCRRKITLNDGRIIP